jgi:hypothetical protein
MHWDAIMKSKLGKLDGCRVTRNMGRVEYMQRPYSTASPER